MDDLRKWLSKTDVAFYQKFVQRCERYGIHFSGKRGRVDISTVHTEEDIEHPLKVTEQVFTELMAE